MNTPEFQPVISLGQLLTIISVLLGALTVGGAGVGVWVSLNNTLTANTQRIHGLEAQTGEIRDITKQLSQSMKVLVTQQINDARQEEKLHSLDVRLTSIETRVVRLEEAYRSGPH